MKEEFWLIHWLIDEYSTSTSTSYHIVLLLYVLTYRKDGSVQMVMPNTFQECLDYLELPPINESMQIAERIPEANSLVETTLFFFKQQLLL